MELTRLCAALTVVAPYYDPENANTARLTVENDPSLPLLHLDPTDRPLPPDAVHTLLTLGWFQQSSPDGSTYMPDGEWTAVDEMLE